jgi:chorismate mutase
LADVRVRIDEIDAELLRLVDARAAIAAEVAAAKLADAGSGVVKFGLRPAREAQVLRRLLALPRAAAGPRLVVRLWRELIAESLARQGPFSLAVCGGGSRTLELSRARFGAAVPTTVFPTPQAALAAARGEGVVAVIGLEDPLPWWMRLLGEPDLVVFDALPAFAGEGPTAALAIARLPLEPSGGDRTFFVTDTPLAAAEVLRLLGDAGLVGDLVHEISAVKLFALAGFIEPQDARLGAAPGRLKGVVGAAPLPFDL